MPNLLPSILNAIKPTRRIKPTYGKGGIPGCYMCRAWVNNGHFIVTAIDVAGHELRWEATDDPAAVGEIIKRFAGDTQ